jgi:hypothetical protein
VLPRGAVHVRALLEGERLSNVTANVTKKYVEKAS